MDTDKQAQSLSTEIAQAIEKLNIVELESELQKLQVLSQAADFWQDNQVAQDVMKRISQLEARIVPWRELEQTVADITDLIELKDASLAADLQKQLSAAQQTF